VSITPTDVPSTPATVTTTNVNNYIKIDWVAPASNGESITGYTISILEYGTTDYSETVYCDGSNSLIISQTYCMVPMSVLTTTPFSYPKQTIV